MWDKLKPYSIELLRIAWNDASETGIIDGVFDVENEFVQKTLKDLAKRVRGIDETTQTDIQTIIGRQASEGLSTDEVRALIRDAMGTLPARAEMIARTETATAAEMGNHLAWRASGVVDRKEWLLGPSPCPECQAIHAANSIVDLDGEFAPGILHPPAHPSCTCATAPVLK